MESIARFRPWLGGNHAILPGAEALIAAPMVTSSPWAMAPIASTTPELPTAKFRGKPVDPCQTPISCGFAEPLREATRNPSRSQENSQSTIRLIFFPYAKVLMFARPTIGGDLLVSCT
jgi:hypothetical protein